MKKIIIWFFLIFKLIVFITLVVSVISLIYWVIYVVSISGYGTFILYLFIPFVIKYFKPLVFALYKFIKYSFLYVPGKIIYLYKRGRNILNSEKLFKDDVLFLLFPLKWEIFYDLDSIEKMLLSEKFSRNRYMIWKINQYFSWVSWMKEVKIINYSVSKEIKTFTLYRPVRLKESEIYKLCKNDILHAIWLRADKNSLILDVKSTIKLTIKKKIDNTIYNIDDYLVRIPKWSYCFWFSDNGTMVNKKLDFSWKHHLGVYGTSWSWKSNFVTSLIYSSYIKNNWKFIIIDPKWDMSFFKGLERITYAHKISDIIKVLKETKWQMNIVNEYFHENNYRNYATYYENDKSDRFLPTFIFIEEFSILLDELEKKDRELVIKIIKDIAIRWRSIAYNLVFSLQIPLKHIIGNSEITRMIDQVSFQIEDSMKQYIFWESKNIHLSDLWIWEAYIKQWKDINTFKSFYVSDKSLKALEKYKKKSVSKKDEYLEHAKLMNKFNKKEAITFGLSRSDFDELSTELQNSWVIYKSPNNSLLFKETSNSDINNEMT